MKKTQTPRKTLAAGIARVLMRLHYPLDVMSLCVRWYVAYSGLLIKMALSRQNHACLAFVEHERLGVEDAPAIADVGVDAYPERLTKESTVAASRFVAPRRTLNPAEGYFSSRHLSSNLLPSTETSSRYVLQHIPVDAAHYGSCLPE
jgi:hypothetical protein